MIALTLDGPVMVLGGLTGMLYGLLAVGLVLVYRANRVINFAHGEMGAFAAALFSLMVVRWDLPYWLCLVVALAVAGGIGVTSEVMAIRRLRHAPALMSIVATLGIGQLLLSFGSAINPAAGAGITFPSPPGLPTFDIGALTITRAYTAMLILGPLAVAGLAWFLRSSRWGRALRAAAANPDAARLAGIPAARMSSLAWFLAAALSALTAILVSPTRGFAAASAFGPSLLLRALAAAVLAKFDRLGIALVAGLGIGVLEQVVLDNTAARGAVDLVLLVVVVVGMLLQRPARGRLAERSTWTTVQPWRPMPRELRNVWILRHGATLLGCAAVAATAAVIATVTNATAYTLITIMSLAVVGLGASIVCGMLGELSLGLVATGVLGAVASIEIATRTGSFPIAFAAAAVVSGALSLALGALALRSRGLLLTVSSLSFAVVVSSWALGQDWALGRGERPGRPVIGSFAFDSGKRYAWLTLVFLVVAVVLATTLRRGAVGRRMVASRDNDDALRSFGTSASTTRLLGLFLGGAFAGIGVALHTHALPVATPEAFPVSDNIDVVAMTVIGGLGIVAGPLLGALYIVGLPAFLPLDSAALAASAVGWLLLIMYVPGGLARVVAPLRARVLRTVAARRRLDPALLDEGASARAESVGRFRVPATETKPVRSEGGDVLLHAHDLERRFGGVFGLRNVDLTIEQGTIVGVIGPNGAGKTTLFEVLGGFTRPDDGCVRLHGRDITTWSPARRARAGLVRGFQDAALFPSLTVRETVELALERRHSVNTALAIIGIDRHRRARRAEADELIAALGLATWADITVGELSTGTRRITELACLVAMRPTLMLLDEPSSGLAQREVEALARVLRELRDVSGITIALIDHDIPLVMEVADRVVAMMAGQVLRDGAPSEVRDDPAVIDAYLGAEPTAIQRSGEIT